MRASLLLFCGIPGSGKTTIAKIVAKMLRRAVHIQTDGIRSMLSEPAYTKGESRFVYESVVAIAGEALKAGYDTILDGTYLREEFREEPIRRLRGLYRSCLTVHVACDIMVAFERNLSRQAQVPKESFLRLYSQFRSPGNALRIDTERTSPELAAEAILLQLGRSRNNRSELTRRNR